MNGNWWVRSGVIVAGVAVGSGLRAVLLHLIGHEVIALAAINLVGCFLLGLVSGLYGPRITLIRLLLAVGGMVAFTSWSGLRAQPSFTGALIATMETFFGAMTAGLGHLLGWRIMGGDTR